MSAPLRFAEAATRSWVGVYTAAMPAASRAARRSEIESDLWEHIRAASEDGLGLVATAREVLGRLVRGMPSDLLWRFRKGGWEMQSNFVVERSTGLIMLLILLLGAAGLVGTHGVGSDEPYFSSDFPDFARNLGDHTRQLIFQFTLALALIPAAGLLYLTFRRQGRLVAAAGSSALLVSSALFFGSAVAGVRLHTLAEIWNDSGTRGDSVWFAARDATGFVELFGFTGALAFATSFVVFGVVIARNAPLPRWFGRLALLGAGVTIVGVAGVLARIELLWFVFVLGLFFVLVSFVITGAWLALRGTRASAGPPAAAP